MKERDIFEEIVTLGKRRGVLTYDEINEALPSEFFSPDELEDLMDVLSDMGVKVVDYEEGISPEEEIEEEVEEHERAEDLVQAYFNSMGDISILTKYEEIALAKKLEEGRNIIRETISTFPLFERMYASIDIEMGRSLALRDSLKSRNVEVSINDLILRASTQALLKFPHLNSTFAGDDLLIYSEINIALAIALDEGLITPVIHHCEKLSLAELAGATKQVIERARTGHLRPEDLEDGTFTVTNLGMFGISNFQAIVNPPQAAILAVGALRRVPVFDVRDRVTSAQLINANVSADHRVTDGAEVARFLQELKRILEDAFELV